jgi:hypothetical protein
MTSWNGGNARVAARAAVRGRIMAFDIDNNHHKGEENPNTLGHFYRIAT